MRKLRVLGLLVGGVFVSLLVAQVCLAQSALVNIPRQSQHALLTQRIGITDVAINYHRPLANGRKIWGGLVPYGQVWRAGANENTTITFSDPVTVEGQPLDKGTYGLHMIPGEDQWTAIFSKMSDAWGSFTYDEKEDALRVAVKPQATDLHDAVTYDFDDLKADSAVMTLRWEKVAVPVKIAVNVNDIVAASLHKQLRGLAQYTWDGWDDAAQYLLSTKTHLDDALAYEEKSIQVEERYDNLLSKSQILEAMNKADDAAAAKKMALAKASPFQLHSYARQLQGQKKQDEAFAIFQTNYKNHPDQWFVHSGMARVLTAKGDFPGAVAEMQKSHDMAPTQFQIGLAGMVKRLENKEDINK
jgi:tetratricopeptide (TPR) repeat protein